MAFARRPPSGRRLASLRRRHGAPCLLIVVIVVLAAVGCCWNASGLPFVPAPPPRSAQASRDDGATVAYGLFGMPLGLSAIASPANAIAVRELEGFDIPQVPTPDGSIMFENGEPVFVEAPIGVGTEAMDAVSGDVFLEELQKSLEAFDVNRFFQLVGDAWAPAVENFQEDVLEGNARWNMIGGLFFLLAGIANIQALTQWIMLVFFGEEQDMEMLQEAQKAAGLLRERRLAKEAETRGLLGDLADEDKSSPDEDIELAGVPDILAAEVARNLPADEEEAPKTLQLPPKKRKPLDPMPEFTKGQSA
mmetsp:Transcript_159264/g.510967  ORF Transcript_159264/g.510967 Transcript_159264/m.510967 type:complete len:306 (+) Transcript_159264:54-971(+)